MRKKGICFSIIVGLFLLVGLGASKQFIEFNRDTKENINSHMLISIVGPIFPEPEVSKPVII